LKELSSPDNLRSFFDEDEDAEGFEKE